MIRIKAAESADLPRVLPGAWADLRGRRFGPYLFQTAGRRLSNAAKDLVFVANARDCGTELLRHAHLHRRQTKNPGTSLQVSDQNEPVTSTFSKRQTIEPLPAPRKRSDRQVLE